MFLILFKDGACMPFQSKPSKNHFQEDARFFKVDGTVGMGMLSAFYANNFNHDLFNEIEES